ncbi:ribbon-helix-helix domain-containing protein [Pararhizobium antarcticum]|uniref:CopG family transcriptional regulator n=1 Tax=Pararhizobium antarcticum TaxID=1798805 RepID=A0A657LSN6_9HYPH|nr:CopG family transcriptional regulator [Pararhizobium antarcticum]OJF95851.1 CopG family transcriptional regulator [Pararhizobium antarcticum]OJF99294.1 CopG family transcriptional regulator [Rhizobium sp. 58]
MNQKLSITLPAELVEVINRRVETGAYASTSEVLEAAMQLFLADERAHEEAMASIRVRVKASLDDPRPRLSSDGMRQHLDGLFEKHRPS